MLDRDPYVEAKKSGLICVVPKSNELMVDIDSEEQFNRFCKAFGVMRRYRKLEIVSIQFSRSGAPRRHIYLKTTRVSPRTRVALQAMLCSDAVRENLSMQRIVAGQKHPTVFFEKVGFCKRIDPQSAGPSMMLVLSLIGGK